MLRHASIVSLPPSEDPEDEDDIVNEIHEIDDLDHEHDDHEPFIDLEVATSQLHNHSHLIGKSSEQSDIQDALNRNLKIVVAEAVELEPQDDDVDTENEDDGRRRRELDHNLAMNNFADQITQHISDHIPDDMREMHHLPISEPLDPLSSSDLQEAIELNSDDTLHGHLTSGLENETDTDSDESHHIGHHSSEPIRSIHPSQLVSHPSQLVHDSGSMQQLLQDQFTRAMVPLQMTNTEIIQIPNMFSRPQAPVTMYSGHTLVVPNSSEQGQILGVSRTPSVSSIQIRAESPKPNSNKNAPSSPPSPQDRKKRWRPTSEQKDVLERFWSQNQYPDQDQKQYIAQQLGDDVTYKQITSWFKHKRENDKAKGKFTYKFTPAAKFTNEQVDMLESVFNREPYAKGKTLQELAKQLGVTEKRVQNWFKHKRSRLAQQGKFEYKPRNLLNEEQITFLKGAFCSNASPTPDVCEQLGSELNIKPEQVSRWFSSERTRKRRRAEQAKLGLMSDNSSDEDEEDSDKERVPRKKSKQRKAKSSATTSFEPHIVSSSPILLIPGIHRTYNQAPTSNSSTNESSAPTAVIPLSQLHFSSVHSYADMQNSLLDSSSARL